MTNRELAVKYLKTLTPYKRQKLRQMVEAGIICGKSFAESHGSTASMLTSELKNIYREG